MFDRNLEQWFDEAKQDGNPYLQLWFAAASVTERQNKLYSTDFAAWQRSIANDPTEHCVRRELAGKYAWAVPCEAALSAIASFGPIVEMGAGTGYWAWLLRKRGVDVIAYDDLPPGPNSGNHFHQENPCWTVVKQGRPEILDQHSDRTLLLCWPPYDDPMALESLTQHGGKCVVFIGEHQGGCNADDAFFDKLEAEFEETDGVEIPQFEHLHDYMTVYARKE